MNMLFKSYMKSNKNVLLSILAMRIIVNHFYNESRRMFIVDKKQDVLDTIGSFIDIQNIHISNFSQFFKIFALLEPFGS